MRERRGIALSASMPHFSWFQPLQCRHGLLLVRWWRCQLVHPARTDSDSFPPAGDLWYGKAGETGVHGTRPPELVHCPAPSCFTTQRAGLPNLRWQTVTYITSLSGQWRLVVFERVCIHSRFLLACYCLPGIAPTNIVSLSFFVHSICHASFLLLLLFPLISLLLLPSLPVSRVNVKWLCWREARSHCYGSWGLCPSVQGIWGRSQ